MPKYKFKIQTNNKIVVENIKIISADQKTAEIRLGQMYLRYDILHVEEIDGTPNEVATFEKIIDLISK